ncbi:MAG: FecR family protein [Flavitalea sp.]
MHKHHPRLQHLFDRYVSGQYTPDEWTEFWDIVQQLDGADPVLDQMQVWWNKQDNLYDLYAQVDSESILKRILAKDNEHLPVPVKSINFFRTATFRYAAAILLCFGISAYYFSFKKTATQAPLVVAMPSAPASKDIAPGMNKAILTLSNGEQVILDNTHKKIISDGGVEINKQGGELIYGRTDIIAFNTMTTPRGGQYKLSLPDGTKVWLNAASSITYPTVFTNNERKVFITGEAYFEVAKNAQLPFRVQLPDQSQVQALGTQFNVNAYADEPLMTTTLLEGSVKIDNSILKPGEAYRAGKVSKANTEAAVAWKNGVFIFYKADLQSVMRQLSRWYDVDVKYEGNIRIRTFSGKIERDLSLSDLLDGLKRTDVHFRIEGKKLIVTS